ncbi:MAG: ABC transporter permease [Eubacteriales bacterium]|nr:ABC transporter permease [Eubacteriales bacterium]
MKRLALLAAVLWTTTALLTQALVFTAQGLLSETTRDNQVKTFAVYLAKPVPSNSGSTAGFIAGSTAAKVAAAGFTSDSGIGLQARAVESMRQSLKKAIAEQQVQIVDAFAGFSEQVLTRVSMDNQSNGTITVNLTGIGGRFADFRQLQILSGSFINEQDWNERSIVLDETAAWQLFGAIDIAGMTLSIQNHNYTVNGVVRIPQNDQNLLAIAEKPQAFVSYAALHALDPQSSITAYEVRLPEPVPGMGQSYFNDALNAGGLNPNDAIIVLHEQRLTFTHLLADWAKIGRRAIQDSTIVLPWWENANRAAADWASVLIAISGMALLLLGLSVSNLTWREQKVRPARPICWTQIGQLSAASLFGLVLAMILIHVHGELVPSGWSWFFTLLGILLLPAALVTGFGGFQKLRIVLPDKTRSLQVLRSTSQSITEKTRIYILVWIKWLKSHWPATKETPL